MVSERQGRHFYFLGVIRKFDSASIWAGEELGLLVKFIDIENLLWLRLAGKLVLRREAIGSNLPCKGKGSGQVARRSKWG